MLTVTQTPICTLKIVYLTLLVTLGAKPTVKMPFLTPLSTPITSGMELCPEEPTLTLITTDPNQYLR